MEYIIVQAGGKGTRLGYLTENKPKALVPVDNLPMIFHLFRRFPDKRFIIITGYKRDVFRRYLEIFAEVKYIIAEEDGTGTCSGIKKALDIIPKKEPFMLIWSDLVLSEGFSLPDGSEDCVGISGTFPCRWKYENGKFSEEISSEKGVAGLFVFTGKGKIEDVPESGEFVRFLQGKELVLREIRLDGTREFGLMEEYERLLPKKCRPFNSIAMTEKTVVKEAVDEQGRALAVKERLWYKKAAEIPGASVPKVFRFEPLELERIRGSNIYECCPDHDGKRNILSRLTQALNALHENLKAPADRFSMREAYYTKTVKRLEKVRSLIPYADERYITVNGKKCRNVFFFKSELEKAVSRLPCDEFCFIHGDCTFSNIILSENGEPVLIDPRGYFGYNDLIGDPMYDFAKLYYSVIGSYDMFNLGKFRLSFADGGVCIKIKSNGWEDMEDEFFSITGADRYYIRLIHAVIWLSLTTYAWQDYDSVCAAFYNGLYYLEDVLC